MKRMLSKIVLFSALLMSLGLFSQNVNVSIDLQKQRFLGDESNLDRAKYFNVHNGSEEPKFPTFLKDNNVGFGRQFWDPFSALGKGNFPDTPASSDGILRPVRRFISTVNPKNVWSPEYDPVVAANAAVRYWVDQVDTNGRPEYWEPFNEPFIKAKDFEGGTYTNGEIVTLMSQWFKEMAIAVHNKPELANMKVIGFSSAFPSYARRDFSETWQNHMKKFIDIAGADIDALSVHPYDGVNQVGQANGRSGSNSEAILDLIESYTDQKFNSPKKLAITEYGVIESNEAFPAGPAPSYYNEARSAVSIFGLNSMLFNFLERQDNIEICIPFVTGRADFFYSAGFAADGGDGTPRPYTPAYLRPTELSTTSPFRNDDYVLTFKAHFYEFWKDVKGDRAKITSDDLDVQVQAFVDGNTAYVAINNLDDADKTVNLSFLSGGTNISNVKTSALVINGQNTPIYEEGTDSSSLPSSITLRTGETKLFTITYSTPVQFTSSIVRKKYYGTSPQASNDKAPTVEIDANTAYTFNIKNVVTAASGDATLRLSVGIPLTTGVGSTTPSGLDRLPSEVTFNSTSLTIPTNWKGYDQTGRADFYAMLEFDVPYNLVNDGDNEVTVTYAKTGGRLAAAVLSIENDDTVCTKTTLYADEDNDGLGNPNVTIQSCSPVRGFVDNADDKCIDDIENTCQAVRIPGVVQAEEFTENNGVVANGTFIESINDGDSSTYDVDNTISGNLDVRINASAPASGGGTVTIFAGSDELGSIPITSTGDFNTFQDFEGSITIQSTGFLKLRFEYTGSGTGDLFNIDSITFLSTEEIIRFSDPNIGEIIQSIPNTTSSITLQLDYTTDTPGQRAGVELRRPNETFFKNSLKTEDTPVSRTNVDFTINFAPGDLPLPPGDYRVLTFIITTTSNGNTFTGGDGVRRFIRVFEPAVDAANDESKSNPRGSAITLDILANDSKEDGTTPLPSEVTIDIDTSTNGQQTQLIVANEGTWDYNETSGELTFTPESGFIDNPTDIEYSLTEISNNITDIGTVNFEYVQDPVANDDSSSNNDAGVVTINILNNDTADGGGTLTAAEVTVDLDPSTPAVDTTFSAGVLGNWSYDTSSGVLTFTPSAEFSGNPPPITYQVTENSTTLSDTATVTVTYREFTLAEFSVTNTGEVCADNNDGSIVITATTGGDYTANITGPAASSDNFTDSLTVSDLDAGDYVIEITDNATGEVFVFNITISEPLDLSVSSKVSQNDKNVTLSLAGSSSYTITLNTVEFTTSESSLTLQLNEGSNNLSVKGEKECQGEYSENIVIGNTINVYPNPVQNMLNIITGTSGEINVSVFSISGTLLSSKILNTTGGKSQLDMQDLASGVYFVAVSTPNSTSTFKIVK